MEPTDDVTLEQRLIAIESKLDTILTHLGITHPLPETDPRRMPEVMKFVHAGKKIQAIKVYRERTGLGLKTAKEAIDMAAARF
ncbi:ribosomal protein L7/L12 [Kitasatospora sp. GP82]|uniref:ribosomal protein L7/L12 n=1 Tax=Kitasatospora sp. GP82 TaxID=3035089 RepID=UPI0024745E39|nr:ribosomal protein L7/L12 [Kitasatospora sp. GP82]MDH6125774.1 ribosomal protein L7/L12 [Kitasatospora sp. GP82]